MRQLVYVIVYMYWEFLECRRRTLLSSSIYTYMHDTPLTMYLGVHHNCRSSPRDRLPLQPAPLCVRGGWLQDQGEPPLMPSPLCCLYDCLSLLPSQVWNYKQKRCIFTLLGHLDYIRTTFFHKVMNDACWWGLVLLVMCPAQWVTVHSRVYVMWCIDSLAAISYKCTTLPAAVTDTCLLNLLTTDDTIWDCVTLATCYQLEEFVWRYM